MAAPIITPPSTVEVYGLSRQRFDAGGQLAAWSTTQGGQIAADSPPQFGDLFGGVAGDLYYEAVTFVPDNITRTDATGDGPVVLTAENVGGESAAVLINVIGEFPQQVSWPNDYEFDKMVVTSDSRTGRRSGRVLGAGQVIPKFELPLGNRTRSQFQEIYAFWDAHYPEKYFRLTDHYTQVSALFLFDGKIKGRGESHVLGEQTVAVRLYIP